jgi:translation initiation factor IF-2
MRDLDSAIENLEAWEAKERGTSNKAVKSQSGKTRVGAVEQFFDRIGVVAITLSAGLKVGDIIEIGREDDAIRQRISSMQIHRKDVLEAYEGDSVGIKLKHPVDVGSDVYLIGESASEA